MKLNLSLFSMFLVGITFLGNCVNAASVCILLNNKNGISATCDGKDVKVTVPGHCSTFNQRGSYVLSAYISSGYKLASSAGGDHTSEYVLVKD